MQTKIMTIRALSSIHPGSGAGIGVIDMPVQRERHTGYPLIPGSSIKGVLRSVYKGEHEDDIFGPKHGDSNSYASSASFSDARLFAYPTRSLKGVFAWITCCEVLRRLKADLAAIGQKPEFDIPNISDSKIICSDTIKIGDKVILEEYDFSAINGNIDKIKGWAKEKFFTNDDDKKSFSERFVIVSDNDFSHFARYSSEVVARIALEENTKTAKKKALFYQEFLPPEILFYSLITFENSRKNGEDAEVLSKEFESKIKNVIQIGGDETIGKGICEINLK
ncbi:MAG: type III-B CRISPR module RAMP protein Cmr4 [Elusimicrobia bacterium]|nr:type III-B CRISPR module RAMP protein Cmr4 [Elusimicrobiota bacterium]